MDASFTPIEVVPSKTPFGLDQLRRSYKTSLSAADAIAACPAVGTADETFEFMFLMPINTPESAESATRVDLVYQGCIADDGEGNPTLPAIKHNVDNPISTATSYTSSFIFPAVAAVPASVQYHGHSTSITAFSQTSETTEEPDDPPAITVDDLITWTLAAEQPAATYPEIAAILLSDVFVQYVVATESADEIVPGQYWQITKRKVMSLFPYAPAS